MSHSMPMEEDLENKKRKAIAEGATTITKHFPVVDRQATSPPILKAGRYSNHTEDKPQERNRDETFAGLSLSYLYLMLDIPPDRDYVERYRIILARLISSLQQADPTAVIVQCDIDLQCSTKEKVISATSCIDHPRRMPRSITQLQKFFPKGRPKRGGGTVCTNMLVLHNESIDDMIFDMI